MVRRGKKPEWQRKIARERIKILFSLAEKELESNPKRSQRYVELARKIALKYNIRLKKQKRKFCKKCNVLLVPSKTAKIRLNPRTKTVNMYCLKCGKVYRYGYKA